MKPLSEGAEEDLAHGGLSGSQPESSAGPSSVGSSAHNTPGNKTNYFWSYSFHFLFKKVSFLAIFLKLDSFGILKIWFLPISVHAPLQAIPGFQQQPASLPPLPSSPPTALGKSFTKDWYCLKCKTGLRAELFF